MKQRQRLRYRDFFRRSDVAMLATIAIGYALSVAALLTLVGRVSNAISDNSPNLFVLIGTLALAGLCQAAFIALEFAIPERISLRIVRDLRLRIYRHMASMAPRQIQHRSRGSLILRLTGDLTMLRTWLSRGMARGAIAAITTLTALGVIAWHDWKIATAIAATFAVGASVAIWVGRSMQRVTAKVRRRRSLLTSNVDEQVAALAVVQLFGRQKGEEARFQRQNIRMTEALFEETAYRGTLRGIADATGWLALAAAFLIGAIEAASGAARIDTILVTILATRIIQDRVRTLSLAHDYWRRAEVSRAKIEDFFNSRSRLTETGDRQRFNHNRAKILFDRVSVDGSLDDFSASVGAGEHIALVGASGSGKTTLLQAAANMVDCTSGFVTIGEQDVAACTNASLWRKIGFIGPDLPLMRGTLRRNLTYRRPGTSDEELQAHIVRCQIADLIDALPGGLDFWITEGGHNLPTGARQRIAIARGLLGNPGILLLDRPTAGLDEESRAAFRALLARYSGTIIHVTDEPREIEMADQVWEVAAGKLASSRAPSAYLASLGKRHLGTRVHLQAS